MMIVFYGDACIAPHAVAIINTQALSRSANITERAVVDGFVGRVVVEVADLARVPRKLLLRRRAFLRWRAIRIDALGPRGLQGIAPHAQDLLDLVSIQGGVLVVGVVHLAGLLAAETARVQSSRYWMTEFARSCIMGASKHLINATIMVCRGKLRRGE